MNRSASMPLAGLGDHRLDEAVERPLLHLDDLALLAHHAARLGVLAQELRIEAGVEVEGVGDVRKRRVAGVDRTHEPAPRRRGRLQRIGLQPVRVAGLVEALPEGVEGDALHVDAERPEGVEIGLADGAPVDELDAQLEDALGLADEVVLVEAEHGVEQADLRDRRLAHADDADLLGLDQGDGRVVRPEDLGHGRGRHPAGRAAADDEDAADAGIGHGARLFVSMKPGRRRARGRRNCGR
jgi:hypothetical protein